MAKILISTEECSSLKEKRQVVMSIKERLKQKFNLSVAEVDHQDVYREALIGIVCVSNEFSYANGLISKAINYIEQYFPGRIIDYEVDTELK